LVAPGRGGGIGAGARGNHRRLRVASQPGRIPDVVEEAQPSIVTVFAEGDGGQEGVGSGVIYRSDGMILTNNHVVSGATHVDVAFADGSRVAGQVTATDPDTDLAVIRVERDELPAAHFQRALPRIGSLAVYTVTPDGPADRAGIRPGDVLTTVAGQEIATVEELFAALRQHEPGETVSISHVRGDKQRTAQVQVTDRPS
jgi:S1-C subfamily serine protease